MTRLISVNTLVGNIGYWLIGTIFPVVVQLMSPDKVVKSIGLFGIKAPLGNYGIPAAKPAWFKAYLIYMIIGFCGMLFAYFRVHERVLPTQKETEKIHFSDYWIQLKQSKGLRYFCWFVLCACLWNTLSNGVWPFFMQYNIGHSEWIAAIGTIGAIPGIFLVALWPWFRKVFGKKGFFYFFIIMFIVGELLLWIWSITSLKNSLWLGYLASFLKSWGLTSATGYMWRLSPELITYAEYHTGKRPAGIIKALTGLVYKIGTVIASFLPAFLTVCSSSTARLRYKLHMLCLVFKSPKFGCRSSSRHCLTTSCPSTHWLIRMLTTWTRPSLNGRIRLSKKTNYRLESR